MFCPSAFLALQQRFFFNHDSPAAKGLLDIGYWSNLVCLIIKPTERVSNVLKAFITKQFPVWINNVSA